ncbi:PFS domain-containing protein [Colletotrichum sojae]|uniref:PFS domain-containing protein n=1 Tax=Colletotrichum sojae TaxID=2175907 RepID=A0A8H6JGS1_9PEZI|nr:PFS domain-containing protein [Colletotrichum sojae]
MTISDSDTTDHSVSDVIHCTSEQPSISISTDSSVNEHIRRTVFKGLHAQQIRDSHSHHAVIRIDWDPEIYIHAQQFDSTDADLLGPSITLTGSPEKAQCLTANHYVRRTWPSIGNAVMQALCESPRKAQQLGHYGHLFIVRAYGSPDTIAQVAQIFTWLSTALRPSPLTQGVIYCTPSFANNVDQIGISPVLATDAVEFYVDFRFSTHPATVTTGHCWHSMFRNPLVMLALVEVKVNLCLWHHYKKLDGTETSYNDHEKIDIEDPPSMEEVMAARHVIG